MSTGFAGREVEPHRFAFLKDQTMVCHTDHYVDA